MAHFSYNLILFVFVDIAGVAAGGCAWQKGGMLPTANPPDLAAFRAAQARIARYVAETPMARLCAGGARNDGLLEAPRCPKISRDLLLKLECLQASGSFKGRGALSKVLALPREVAARGIVTASGGNHGLAVAFAGSTLGVDTTVYLPGRTSEAKAARIARWGAKVVRAGDVWDDAHAAAVAFARAQEKTYIHPFADPDVVAGAGTIALEALEQAPEIDLFVVAIGGGGLALAQPGQLPGLGLARPLGQGLAQQLHLPLGQRLQPGQGAQQRRFARTIGAHNGRPLPGKNRRIHPVQNTSIFGINADRFSANSYLFHDAKSRILRWYISTSR